jgi:hypothetical protein
MASVSEGEAGVSATWAAECAAPAGFAVHGRDARDVHRVAVHHLIGKWPGAARQGDCYFCWSNQGQLGWRTSLCDSSGR